MQRLATGQEAYGLILDDLLGYDTRTLKILVHLYGLLYESIMSNDSWLMTNKALQALLRDPGGSQLLTNNIIVPLRRDTAGSFVEFRTQCIQKKMANVCATEDMARFLDAHAKPRVFQLSEVTQAYEQMSRAIFEPKVLTALGLSSDAAARVHSVITDARKHGVVTDTNSFMYQQVRPLLSFREQALFMEIARAPYSLNIPHLIGSGMIGPQGFRGDVILSTLRESEKKVGAIHVVAADGSVQVPFMAHMDDPYIHWLFSQETLATMTAEQLLAARSTENRKEYLSKQALFLENPSAENWQKLIPAMTAYFQKAAQEVFRIWHRDRYSVDAADGAVVVEGTDTIRIITSNPVHVRGLDGGDVIQPFDYLSVEKMQVVASTYSLPGRMEGDRIRDEHDSGNAHSKEGFELSKFSTHTRLRLAA
jgi:hypothetical protein